MAIPSDGKRWVTVFCVTEREMRNQFSLQGPSASLFLWAPLHTPSYMLLDVRACRGQYLAARREVLGHPQMCPAAAKMIELA